MRLCIFGYYGYGNAGDEAVLAGILHGLRVCGWKIGESASDTLVWNEAASEAEHDALFSIAAGRRLDVIVISGDPAATRRMHGVTAVARGQWRRLWTEAGRADAWLFGGGSLLQDVTGPWTLPYYVSVLQLPRLRRTPILFHAQGVGPIQRPWQQWLAGRALRRMRRVSVRDMASAAWIDRLTGGKATVEVGADPVFLLDPPAESERQAARERAVAAAWRDGEALPRTWLGVALRPWQELKASWSVLRQVLQAVSEQTGAGVLLVPMQDAADEPVARCLADSLGPRAIVAGVGTSFRERMALLAGCSAVVAMRLHAVLFAALSEVPGVALEYDPKVSAAAQALGWPKLSLPLTDSSFFRQVLERQLSQYEEADAVRRRLRAAVAAERAKALADAAGLARELVRLADVRKRRRVRS